jgi:tryptophan synthase alpha chain
VHRYGFRRWAQALKDAGGAGAITPDLIPEEAPEWLEACRDLDLDPIFLVAPSSTDERIGVVGRTNRGFVYAAAVMGVTGARAEIGAGARRLVERVRAQTDLPVAVGLGVSTGAQAAQVASFADGVVVGSALVSALQSGGVEGVRRLAGELAEGVRSPVPA